MPRVLFEPSGNVEKITNQSFARNTLSSSFRVVTRLDNLPWKISVENYVVTIGNHTNRGWDQKDEYDVISLMKTYYWPPWLECGKVKLTWETSLFSYLS